MGKRSGSGKRSLPLGIVILHEDRDILVVDKPAGLLTIGTERERERTAYYFLTDYVRRGNPKARERVFIVHRLDKDTSGVLLFAKSEDGKRCLQEHWNETRKTYLTVVHGRPEKAEDTISSYLAENSAHVVYSTDDPKWGKLSSTAYRVLKVTKSLALLEIDLLTGRKNQIRVHLADIGHPIVGDRKYGHPKDPHNRMALHAQSLTFQHPYTGVELTFTAKPPSHFHQLVGDWKSGDASPGTAGVPPAKP